MKFSVFCVILSFLGIFYSVSFLFFPVQFVSQFGIHLDAGGASIGRLFGGALVGYTISSWLARNQSHNEPFARTIMWATLFFNLACLIVTVNSIMNNLVNSLAWSSVGVHALVILGSLYFLMARRKEAVAS
jgi:hypothetical protein